MDLFNDISEIKEFAPELDVSTPMQNLERGFTIARSKVIEVIGTDVYNKITTEPGDMQRCLKSSLVNFMMNENIVFSEAGKEKDKKMFKYEYEQVRGKYIDYGYSYLDELIALLENSDMEEWENSEQKKSLEKLLITAAEMRELSGLDSMYFFFRIRNIIRDVADDEIFPRYQMVRINDFDERTRRILKRALVNLTLARVIKTFDFFELPRPLRSTLQSEFSGSTSMKDDLLCVSESYHDTGIDLLARLEIKRTGSNTITDNEPLSENDKFYFAN